MADYVGTNPAEVTTSTTTGGHLGLFMGREALRNQWSPLFGEIAARSSQE